MRSVSTCVENLKHFTPTGLAVNRLRRNIHYIVVTRRLSAQVFGFDEDFMQEGLVVIPG
jgi:hypothetical protein